MRGSLNCDWVFWEWNEVGASLSSARVHNSIFENFLERSRTFSNILELPQELWKHSFQVSCSVITCDTLLSCALSRHFKLHNIISSCISSCISSYYCYNVVISQQVSCRWHSTRFDVVNEHIELLQKFTLFVHILQHPSHDHAQTYVRTSLFLSTVTACWWRINYFVLYLQQLQRQHLRWWRLTVMKHCWWCCESESSDSTSNSAALY